MKALLLWLYGWAPLVPTNEYGGMIATWPYPYRAAPERTLAYYTDGAFRTEHGEIIEARSWAEVRDALHTHNLLAFAPNIASWSWTRDAIEERSPRDPEKRTVKIGWSERTRNFVSLKHRQGRYVRQIVRASVWDIKKPEDLSRLRRLFDLCGVGPHASPASLGQALMRKYWPEGGRKLKRPCGALWQSIRNGLTGGRADVIQTGTFDHVYEADQCFSYASHIMSGVPRGAPMIFYEEETMAEVGDEYAWCEVEVTVPPGLRNGILPYRKRRGDKVAYPCEPGLKFEGAFTYEEIKHARSYGYTIEHKKGWSWGGHSDGFREWALACDELRRRAADFGADGWIKMAVVAAIGSFARGNYEVELEYVEKWGDLVDEHGTAAVECGGPENELIFARRRRFIKNRTGHLIHVAAHVWGRGRIALWEKLEESYRLGLGPISTNYDAVIMLHPPPWEASLKMGEWKINEYTHATIEKSRWLTSKEKIATPGVAH